MKILLDTHVLLWLMTDDVRLTADMRKNFLDMENELFFSMASLWEMSIKLSLGKLVLATDWLKLLQDELTVNGIHWLPIDVAHCVALVNLPFHHRDPFDRMLIAQAMTENMAIMSSDSRIKDYAPACI
jgi:PIN domain nuclease of toxin-antitoxin system